MAIPPLLTVLRCADDEEARIEAAQLLGFFALDAGVVAALIDTLQDPDPTLRASAIESLGEIGQVARAATPALVEVLGRAPSPAEREAAAEALGNIGDPGGFDALLASIADDAVLEVRAAALYGLGTGVFDAICDDGRPEALRVLDVLSRALP